MGEICLTETPRCGWQVGTHLAEQGIRTYLLIWKVVKPRAPKPAHALWLALQQGGQLQESEF